MAGTTGLEPATSDVTGRRSNQLNYVPVLAELLSDYHMLGSRWGGFTDFLQPVDLWKSPAGVYNVS
jgi:hypothetical protein